MLNFVVALKTEAIPLIKFFKLKQEPNRYFPVFSSADTTLIISGLGRNQASAATAWLAATKPAPVWVNVGIAGHSSRDLGTVMAAHKVTEATTHKSWYPIHIKSAVAKEHLETEQLITFDEIQRSYQPNTLHDMEASGFYETAIRFSIAELTHSVKIVSDNRSHPVESIDKAGVDELITSNIPQISAFTKHLCHLAKEIQPAVPRWLVDKYRKRWKFTITQQYQLQRLLQRRQALDIDSIHPTTETVSMPDEIGGLRNSKEVLRWLQIDTEAKGKFY